jgi:hypothetical protein
MKIASRILSLVILVVITTVYVGCKKDDDNEKTEEQMQLDKLRGEWIIVSANDSNDRTGDFIDDSDPLNPIKMKLTLGGNYAEGGTYNYSVTGPRPTPSPWPASGTWKFGTRKLSELIRDPTTQASTSGDEIPMGYSLTENGTDTILEIEFTVPEGHQGWEGGRISSVEGGWRFTFTK